GAAVRDGCGGLGGGRGGRRDGTGERRGQGQRARGQARGPAGDERAGGAGCGRHERTQRGSDCSEEMCERAAATMRRSFAKDRVDGSWSSGIQAASIASQSGSFSTVIDPPVARSRKWCTTLWMRLPDTENQ